MEQWQVGDWTITRVADPGFELTLPQDAATVATLQRSAWLHPQFVTDDWALRVGSSALLLQGAGVRILVDPWLAFDDPDRFDARLEALANAGAQPNDIDVVVNSHVDGIGANTRPVSGDATFPVARYYVPAAELEAVRAGKHPAATTLASIDLLCPVTEGCEIAPGVSLKPLPGHNDGHYGVEIAGQALIIGHLFLHPAQIANPGADLDPQPKLIRETRRHVLERCATEGTLLIGPLFAAPGAGTIVADGDQWALEPACVG
jgi:glyoxylase-like metal-dependent hydrolase (beta-lactamase superfamily II)